MTKLTIVDQGAGHFIVDGDLTFATIDIQAVKSFSFFGLQKMAYTHGDFTTSNFYQQNRI